MASDQGQDPVVQEFRARISGADRRILESVNLRVELVAQLHAYKVEHGYPLADPDREAALIAELERANPGPLSNEGLRELYTAILAEWRRHPGGTTTSGRSPPARRRRGTS